MSLTITIRIFPEQFARLPVSPKSLRKLRNASCREVYAPHPRSECYHCSSVHAIASEEPKLPEPRCTSYLAADLPSAGRFSTRWRVKIRERAWKEIRRVTGMRVHQRRSPGFTCDRFKISSHRCSRAYRQYEGTICISNPFNWPIRYSRPRVVANVGRRFLVQITLGKHPNVKTLLVPH